MKKRILSVIAASLCCAVTVSAFAGCDININVKESSTVPSSQSELSSETEPSSQEDPFSQPEPSSEIESSIEPSSEAELSSMVESSEEIQSEEPRELTSKELSKIEKLLGPGDVNNGFVTCLYKKISKVDLAEVFYSGAGISEKLSDDDKDALVYSAGWDYEIFEYVHVDKLSKSKMDSFLKKRTGLKTKDFSKFNSFTYCEETNAYYHAYGDTHAANIDVKSGTVDADGVYTVVYVNENGGVMDSGSYKNIGSKKCVVKFTLNGSTPKFISNTLK